MKKTILFQSTDLKEVKCHYRRVKGNTTRFNKGFAKVKSNGTSGTGYNCSYYSLSTGEMVRNISIQQENDIYKLEIIDFK